MKTRGTRRTHPAVVFAVIAAAAAPHAQSPSAADGGATRRAAATPPSLTVSFASAYEKSPDPLALSSDRPDAQLTIGAAFDKRGRRHRFAFSALSAARYVPGLDTVRQPAHTTHAIWSMRLGRRTEFEAEQRSRHAPLDLLPIDRVTAGPAGELSPGSPLSSSALLDGKVLTLDGSARLTRILDQRSSLRLSASASGSRIDGTGDAFTHNVNGQFSRRLRADTVFHAGYGFGTMALPGATQRGLKRHDLDFGVDYSAPLEFSRRTKFAAGAGTTVLSEDGSRQVRLMPYGSVTHALSKAWSVRLLYERPVQVLAGFSAPLLADSLGVGVTGSIGANWDLTLASAFSRGHMEAAEQGRTFAARTNTARVRRRVGRTLHLEADLFENDFRFGEDASLPAGVPSGFTRRGVRFGLSWSTPLVWN